MTTNPCPISATAAAFITDRAIMGREKYGHTLADANLSAAELVEHAREEAADLLVYLTGLKYALSGAEPERSGHYECLSDKPSGDWNEAFAAPEPARPVVTREAVMRALVSCGAAECSEEYEHCSRGSQCTCKMRINAIMALIEGGGA